MTDLQEVRVLLPASIDSARAARRAVNALRFEEHQEAVFNLRLLITELVTNSLRHADLTSSDTITLELQLRPKVIRAQVTDPGTGFRRPVFGGPPSGTSGRGLFLVDALADRWGVENHHPRVTVWFEIDL
jgi:anti-sigma regulatory factor (Ser/Thr protein kinase)